MASTDPPERDALVLLRETVERGFDDVRDRFDGVDRDMRGLGRQPRCLGRQPGWHSATNQEAFATSFERFAARTAEHLEDLLARIDTLFGGLADLRRHYNIHTEHPPQGT